MSEQESERVFTEQRSSIKVSRNASGKAVFEVKVYTDEEEGELDRIRALAVGQYNALARELG